MAPLSQGYLEPLCQNTCGKLLSLESRLSDAKDARISYRGTPEQRKRLKAIALDRGTSVQQLLDEAVRDYLGHSEPAISGGRPKVGNDDPAITPHGQDERELVAGLLLLFRDQREIAQGVKEIVAGLLSNWINKAKAAMPDRNGGKKSA
jgi:hypothetical protein